jgi:hypothetical protein
MLRRGLRAATVGVALAAGLVVVPSPAAWATGSGFFEIIAVADNDDQIRAFRNINGFDGPMFANPGIPVGSEWSVYNDVHFADIDGDTWDDLIDVGGNGVVRAWRNNGSGGYSGPVVIATGFIYGQHRTRFADIDGDGRDEIISFQQNNEVWAWRNVNGFGGAYTAGYQIIGVGWTDPNWAYFADIDGNGADEIIDFRQVDNTVYGDLWAWRNVGGTMNNPYRFGAVRIGAGWMYNWPETIKFGDLDNDERAEIINVPAFGGTVTAWRNVGGLVHDRTYSQGPVEIAYGFRATRTHFAEVLPR